MENQEFDSLEQLLQHPVFHHFGQLCRIPHPSFQEKALSAAVYSWARQKGFETWQDDWNNVFIRKPASPGYEHRPAVMLQAHLDMVCQKARGVEHDFARDPIHLELKGDLLSTGGRTTLGADDGIGVALAMALLEDDSLQHPELEVLLTTAEEEDMSGAQNVDASDFHAHYLVNIDNAVERHSVTGSCGGFGVKFQLPVTWEAVPAQSLFYHLKVEGLQGGHSGEDIHRGRGNANIFLIRMLLGARKKMPLHLASLHGGTFRLAIPRDAEAMVMVPAAKKEEFLAAVEQVAEHLRAEYKAVASKLKITVELAEGPDTGLVVSQDVTDKFIEVLVLSPNGISEMNAAIPTVVQSSDNLGEIRLEPEENRLVVVYEIRTSFRSKADYIWDKIHLLARLVGGTCEKFAAYPGWPNDPDSKLTPQVQRIYQDLFGEPMEATPIHSGLECGCLMEKRPELDAISLGPDCWDLHSPQERLSVRSTLRMYEFLKVLLEKIQ
ncbi:MAG: aminoacyl-histidine dipeptidase [Acidaminococcus sp.]|nr:aminoacyl-histidine dipeptidase [Acidaminococcus sp.]